MRGELGLLDWSNHWRQRIVYAVIGPPPLVATADGQRQRRQDAPGVLRPKRVGACFPAGLEVERSLGASDPIGGVVAVAVDFEPVGMRAEADDVGRCRIGRPGALGIERLPSRAVQIRDRARTAGLRRGERCAGDTLDIPVDIIKRANQLPVEAVAVSGQRDIVRPVALLGMIDASRKDARRHRIRTTVYVQRDRGRRCPARINRRARSRESFR